MKKVLVIAGPTAAGKSDFAIELAKKYHANIISGDSIQVYKGCDIGSGKVTKEEMDGVKHYLIDILSPKERYTSADFQKMARKIIDSEDNLSIICGGTGMYLKSCLYDYIFNDEEGPSTDPKWEKYTNEELYQFLLERDPEQAKKIHPNNRRRVMRSLTIFERSGLKQSDIVASQNHEMIYDTFIVGCTMDREVLYERIRKRVSKMIDNGLKDEVAKLLESGVTFDDACMQGIGYKEWKAYFEGDSSIDEIKEEIIKHSRQFAKRQYTWFNHQMPVHWFEILECERKVNMINQIDAWIKSSNVHNSFDK